MTACVVVGVLGLTGPVSAAPPPTEADESLFLYNFDGQAPVAPGGTVTFVMTASHYPGLVPQHRTVVLKLPEGVTFRSADNENAAGPCVPDAARTTVTCTTQDPVDQAPASNAAWWVTTDVGEDLPLGEYFTAEATLTTEIPDPDTANNVYRTDVFVTTGGDMSVAITAPPGPWPVGAKFDAKISVHNAGPYRSPADLRTVVLPFSLQNTGWPRGCGADPGVMYCTLPMIEAGQTQSFTIHLTVAEYEDEPVVLSPEVSPIAPDTDPGNNKATYRADIVKPSPSPTPTHGGGGTAGGEPGLPITGVPAGSLALAGLTLLVAGAGALLLSRRPRRR
jgi:hypothetical protein